MDHTSIGRAEERDPRLSCQEWLTKPHWNGPPEEQCLWVRGLKSLHSNLSQQIRCLTHCPSPHLFSTSTGVLQVTYGQTQWPSTTLVYEELRYIVVSFPAIAKNIRRILEWMIQIYCVCHNNICLFRNKFKLESTSTCSFFL